MHPAALGAVLALALAASACAQPAPPAAPLPSERPASVTPSPTPEARADADRAPGFEAWLAGFRARARAEAIPEAVLSRALAGVTPDPTVIERDRFQPEFTRPIWEYLDRAVSETRIANGRAAAARHRATLDRIEARYGVDWEIVVAVWGLESAYGEVMGDRAVIRSLATLAHDGRRRSFAEGELIAALRILAAGDVSADRLRGSWAGAMGHTQFIPTSFLAHAVDFTGDGRRDIWAGDPSDALASTANYLARAGWRRGVPAALGVRLPEGFDYALAGQSRTRAAAEWRAMGVRLDGVWPDGQGAILVPAGAAGPAWLVTSNFRAIRRYNNATSYALAIAALADMIAGRPGAVPPSALDWPRGDRPLSRAETEELQRRLTALGFDTKGADGIVGPNTRDAVRAFQRVRGLVPDAYVSGRLLDSVRAAGG
ncbi:MAG: lytic murein transglycosylase [Paracoccaceae bacterium]